VHCTHAQVSSLHGRLHAHGCPAVFQSLCDQCIDCHSFDMRTFGKSETRNKERGKISNFQHLINDFLGLLDKMQKGVDTLLS
jgi:alpha-beta hydrolase superfamily lysophospholipase